MGRATNGEERGEEKVGCIEEPSPTPTHLRLGYRSVQRTGVERTGVHCIDQYSVQVYVVYRCTLYGSGPLLAK